MKTFLGEGPFTWLALVVAAMTLLIMADALAGHYRSGFRVHVQYAPFPIGAALVVAGVVPALSPRASWTGSALQVTGWLAVGAGVTGSVAHHLWGVRRAAGGYRLLLHHLMYGPPPWRRSASPPPGRSPSLLGADSPVSPSSPASTRGRCCWRGRRSR